MTAFLPNRDTSIRRNSFCTLADKHRNSEPSTRFMHQYERQGYGYLPTVQTLWSWCLRLHDGNRRLKPMKLLFGLPVSSSNLSLVWPRLRARPAVVPSRNRHTPERDHKACRNYKAASIPFGLSQTSGPLRSSTPGNVCCLLPFPPKDNRQCRGFPVTVSVREGEA